MNNIQCHFTQALAARHLPASEHHRFDEITGYCIDAPELMPAGGHFHGYTKLGRHSAPLLLSREYQP